MLEQVQQYFQPWLVLLSDDPGLRLMQGAMILAGAIAIFLVFYATRDILLRTHSFAYMFFCILLVAVVPVIGFLIYVLIRPPRTIKQREMEEMLIRLSTRREAAPVTKKPKPKKVKKGSGKKEDISL